METFGRLVIGLAIIVGLFFGISTIFATWANANIKSLCASFSRESGRETKFVKYNFWMSDCLTPQEGGLWISAFNLIGK